MWLHSQCNELCRSLLYLLLTHAGTPPYSVYFCIIFFKVIKICITSSALFVFKNTHKKNGGVERRTDVKFKSCEG